MASHTRQEGTSAPSLEPALDKATGGVDRVQAEASQDKGMVWRDRQGTEYVLGQPVPIGHQRSH